MNVRRFTESDRIHVNALLTMCATDPFYHPPGEYAFVLEDVEIVGFVWAFADPRTRSACVDYFAVDPSRRNGVYALYLMQALLSTLLTDGIETVVGILPNDGEYTRSLQRIYRHLGMKCGDAITVSGSIESILKKLPERKAA